jgi:hypothetical protein
MKRYLILLFALAISLTSFGQIDETNNIVRNNTLSPARVANALDILKVFSTTGTDTYAISVTVGSHSPYAGGLTYTTGDIFKIKIGNTNTSGTTSLNVNTDGAIPLKDAEGNNFGIGDLAANSIHAFYYDGTNFREISGSGGGGGAGTVNSGTQYRLAYYATTTDAVSEAGAITAAKALKSDANGVPTHFDTSTEPSLTELTYVKGVTSAIQTQFTWKESLLTSNSSSTASGTVTLDMNSVTQRMFIGSASFATSKTIAFSNDGSALVFSFQFEVTNVAGTLVFPSNAVMADTNWNTGTQTWTPPGTGKYVCTGVFDGTDWKVNIAGPYL